jgi:heme exporter protein D
MTSLIQWLSMGGYGLYVWPAYGLVCSVLVVNLFVIKRQKNRLIKSLQQWYQQS